MRHPQNRLDRRAIRDYYISYRRKIILNTWSNWKHGTEIPHEGSSHWAQNAYQKYLWWQTLSEDDIKVLEVEAALDKKEVDKPSWHPMIWGQYAKYNLVCSCRSCRTRVHYGWYHG